MSNSKKKILFLITDLGHGGAEHVLINLVNSLSKEKYDITIQTLFDVGVNRKYINSQVEYIPGLKKQFRGNVIAMRMFSPRFLYKVLVKDKYDILVAYLDGCPARVISGCPNKKTPKVTWVHGEYDNAQQLSYAFGNKKNSEKAYNSMSRIICVADSVKNNFTSLIDVKVPIDTLYNVNDTEFIIKKSNDNIGGIFDTGCTNIISVGRLIDIKGYDRLIRIHKRLLDSGNIHHIFVLGDGNKKELLNNQIVDIGVDKTFHLLGYKDNPYKYIKAADLFVCSSLHEGFSTAVTESLIIGTPVISTNVSGAVELLGENNEYGIVTENNEDSLYESIKRLLTDKQLLTHYKHMAAVRGVEFNKEETVMNIENMLDNL